MEEKHKLLRALQLTNDRQTSDGSAAAASVLVSRRKKTKNGTGENGFKCPICFVKGLCGDSTRLLSKGWEVRLAVSSI